jgi:hypothetical protein
LGFGIWDLAHKVEFGIWNLALSNLGFGFWDLNLDGIYSYDTDNQQLSSGSVRLSDSEIFIKFIIY